MKVLFISSGNAKTHNRISPIVYAQGTSLIEEGVDVQFYAISGKGFFAYIKSIPKIRKVIKEFKPDVVHAHYSLSGFAASLAGARPLVVSLMGSDVKKNSFFKFLIYFFYSFCWNKTIVKSEDMKKSLDFNKLVILPNGVNIDLFYPLDKTECQKNLGWNTLNNHLLFAANPVRVEKNFQLTYEAFETLESNIELHSLTNILPSEIATYMNASDVILLSSLWEGSPNVVKEAAACNLPIVTTSVGDTPWVLEGVEGCYVTDFSTNNFAEAIKKALEFSKNVGRTKGREKILALGLDSNSVAKKIINIYESIKK
jgi:teichuronic acid biosynthesis glycosyltransferase TuaC